MSRYYTKLTNDTPDLIKVSAEITPMQLSKLRRLTDAKQTDSFNDMVKKLLNQKPTKII